MRRCHRARLSGALSWCCVSNLPVARMNLASGIVASSLLRMSSSVGSLDLHCLYSIYPLLPHSSRPGPLIPTFSHPLVPSPSCISYTRAARAPLPRGYRHHQAASYVPLVPLSESSESKGFDGSLNHGFRFLIFLALDFSLSLSLLVLSLPVRRGLIAAYWPLSVGTVVLARACATVESRQITKYP